MGRGPDRMAPFWGVEAEGLASDSSGVGRARQHAVLRPREAVAALYSEEEDNLAGVGRLGHEDWSSSATGWKRGKAVELGQ
jgi:hypothetical protein